MRTILLALLVAISAGIATPALAASEALSDPAQEARAQALDADLRCLVCQGESLAESEAPLARDLRRLVRQRIAAGDRDDQVKAYLVARYGEGILMTPPFAGAALALWLGPVALLVLGGLGGLMVLRRQGRGA